MARKGKIKELLPVLLPILLPVALLLTYLVKESLGQLNDPVQILASIDPSGDGTAYLSTILPDGAQAVWTCSSGKFTDTGSSQGYGRSVTWQASPGYMDSVTVVVVTPSATDTVRFLPVILEVTPTITVSSAYHLAILERSRSLSLPAGSYTIIVEDDDLLNYDGLTILIGHFPGNVRDAWSLFPGDTMSIDLPLGAEFEAVGLDNLENALDNTGSIFIRFIRDESASASLPETPVEETVEPEEEPEELEEAEETLETDSLEMIILPDTLTTTVDSTLIVDLMSSMEEDSLPLEADSIPAEADSASPESQVEPVPSGENS